MNKPTFKQFKSKLHKSIPSISKNLVLISVGVVAGMALIVILNPSHIVQKSLNLVGIDTGTEQTPISEQTVQTDQVKTKESENPSTTSNADGSAKTDDTTSSGSPKQSTPEPTGSHTVITPEDVQAHKDNGEPLLIAKTDWDVKINSRSPISCGTSSNPCSIGQQAKVNVSAYNIHTNELLPITECNGTVNKPYSFSSSTTTSLIDDKHCEITYSPNQTGMYRLQIELYLSKSVYTDTIYWGGWVWGTDSANADGYFVQ